MFEKSSKVSNQITPLGIALAALMVFSGAGAARASDWDHGCRDRIDREQHELDRAIARHGYRSRQAQNDRRELDRLYGECRVR
jgi:hypothetical protein